MAAGVDFIQTQLIFDMPAFAHFMELVRQENIHEDAFIVAGIPVVTSSAGLAVLPRFPGVNLPPAAVERLERSKDIQAEGVALATELATEASRIPGVAGVHLMLFGPDHAVLPQIARRLKTTRSDAAAENEAFSRGPASVYHSSFAIRHSL